MNEIIKSNTIATVAAGISAFYLNNESTILAVGSIATSGGAVILAAKNSHDILEIISDGKEILSKNQDPALRKRIYLDILKELTPKVAPIMVLYGISVTCTILNKRHSDKKIADLTATAGLAQSALLQYQLWKKEAEKELDEEQVKEVNNKVAEEVVKQCPPTKQNTYGSEIKDMPTMFCWKDGNTPNRFLWSFKSENDVLKWAIEQNGELNALRCDNNEISINDFYAFLSEGLDVNYEIPSYNRDNGLKWRLTSDDIHHYAEIVSIDTGTTTAPDGRPINAFHCNFCPF